jgi:hypothetical protein
MEEPLPCPEDFLKSANVISYSKVFSLFTFSTVGILV